MSSVEIKSKEIRLVEIGAVKLNQKNTNRHSAEQIERLSEIIKYQGFREPVVVSNLSGVLIAGEGRYLAAKKLGLTHIPATFQDFENEEQEYAFGVSTNAIASWAELDLSAINTDLADLGPDFDIDMLGIKDFVLEPADKYGDQDADEVPSPGVAYARLGELYTLGQHRLLCGDSTDSAQVQRLMNGEKADMVFTDPPYNVAGRTQMQSLAMIRPNSYGKLKGSDWDQDFDPEAIFPSFELVLSEDSSAYVCTNHFLAGKIWEWMARWSDYYGGCVWVKDNPMPSMSKRHWTWDHEHVCYATKGKHVFNFPSEGHARATWELAKSRSNDLHPTQKPVEVPERAIVHSSNSGQLVTDLFLGSGSTLIACEKTNRKCYGSEIDPIYCGVILDRWAKFTGKDPVREDGKPWSEIKADALRA